MVLAAAVAAALLVPGEARAHGTLTPPSAVADTVQAFELIVPGDRPDAEIVGVELRAPDGLVVESAEARQPLWTVTWDDEAVQWQGGPVPRGGAESFAFTARLPSDEGRVEVTLVESYDDGEEAAFRIPLGVTSAAGDDGDVSGVAVAALVIALASLALSTAAIVVALRGRTPPLET